MKNCCKTIFVLLFLFMGILFSKIPVNLGIQTGANMANATVNNESVKLENRTGFIIGGIVEIEFNRFFAIQNELMYVQKGAKISPPFSGLFPGTRIYDYITFPILLKAGFGFSKFKMNLNLGPDFGVCLKSGLKTEDGTFYDYSDRTNLIDFALDLGLELSYKIKPGIILFSGLRVSGGVIDTDNDPSNVWLSNGVLLIFGTKFTL